MQKLDGPRVHRTRLDAVTDAMAQIEPTRERGLGEDSDSLQRSPPA